MSIHPARTLEPVTSVQVPVTLWRVLTLSSPVPSGDQPPLVTCSLLQFEQHSAARQSFWRKALNALSAPSANCFVLGKLGRTLGVQEQRGPSLTQLIRLTLLLVGITLIGIAVGNWPHPIWLTLGVVICSSALVRSSTEKFTSRSRW